MRAVDQARARELADALVVYEASVAVLPGIASQGSRESFLEQLIESERRNQFYAHVAAAPGSAARADPQSRSFDPLRASVLHHRAGNGDEAFWCLFLFIHFGKNRHSGYQYAAGVYGRLGEPGKSWNWASVCSDLSGFRNWLDSHVAELKGSGRHGFGNHRKYESLSGSSEKGTGAAVASYIDWIGPSHSHKHRFDPLIAAGAGDPMRTYDLIYRSMADVSRFGRIGRFDYLSSAGKLGLLPVEPGHAYLSGASGPLDGARLLFGEIKGSKGARVPVIGQRVIELGRSIGVRFDALEDAMCNWQKSPSSFRPFRG